MSENIKNKIATPKTKSKLMKPLLSVLIFVLIGNLVYFYYLKQTSCPDGYIKILDDSLNLCVAKYEMKKSKEGLAVSTPAGKPWVKITLEEAISACRANGSKYDLMTINIWNYLATSLSEVPENWNTGKKFLGRLNAGYISGDATSPLEASSDDRGANCFQTGKDCDALTWDDSRRTHAFTDQDDLLWDFSGNVAEFTYGEIEGRGSDYERTFVSLLSKNKYQMKTFGPEFLCKEERGMPQYCGYGYFSPGFNLKKGEKIKIELPDIVRGGSWKLTDKRIAGIFATSFIMPGSKAADIGFRCTFVPMAEIHSFTDLTNFFK